MARLASRLFSLDWPDRASKTKKIEGSARLGRVLPLAWPRQASIWLAWLAIWLARGAPGTPTAWIFEAFCELRRCVGTSDAQGVRHQQNTVIYDTKRMSELPRDMLKTNKTRAKVDDERVLRSTLAQRPPRVFPGQPI